MDVIRLHFRSSFFKLISLCLVCIIFREYFFRLFRSDSQSIFQILLASFHLIDVRIGTPFLFLISRLSCRSIKLFLIIRLRTLHIIRHSAAFFCANWVNVDPYAVYKQGIILVVQYIEQTILLLRAFVFHHYIKVGFVLRIASSPRAVYFYIQDFYIEASISENTRHVLPYHFFYLPSRVVLQSLNRAFFPLFGPFEKVIGIHKRFEPNTDFIVFNKVHFRMLLHILIG